MKSPFQCARPVRAGERSGAVARGAPLDVGLRKRSGGGAVVAIPEPFPNQDFPGRCYDIVTLEPLDSASSAEYENAIDFRATDGHVVETRDGRLMVPPEVDHKGIYSMSWESQSRLISSSYEFQQEVKLAVEADAGAEVAQRKASTGDEVRVRMAGTPFSLALGETKPFAKVAGPDTNFTRLHHGDDPARPARAGEYFLEQDSIQLSPAAPGKAARRVTYNGLKGGQLGAWPMPDRGRQASALVFRRAGTDAPDSE